MKDRIKKNKAFNSFYDLLGPEDHLHLQVCNYLRAQYPRAYWIHVPNEGRRSKFERWKMRVLKAKPGFPDIAIFDRGGLAIELKIKPNKPSEAQLASLEMLQKIGWTTAVCYTFEEAKEIIDKHFQK